MLSWLLSADRASATMDLYLSGGDYVLHIDSPHPSQER